MAIASSAASASASDAFGFEACLEKLRLKCTTLIGHCSEDQFLQRASKICSELALNVRKDAKGQDVIAAWLKDFTQAVLDVTFFEENQLVEKEFSGKHAKVTLQDILDWFRRPEELVANMLGTEIKAEDVLGKELMECLLWRRGALLYMYCSTLQEKPERLDQDRQQFLQSAHNGVVALKQMLQVRKPLTAQKQQVITNDDSTLQLLQKGLFSDTHMLALMYGGELCYWYKKYGLDPVDVDSNNTTFNATQTGEELLELYIQAVKGPLSGKGWSLDRAEQLLTELRERKETS